MSDCFTSCFRWEKLERSIIYVQELPISSEGSHETESSGGSPHYDEELLHIRDLKQEDCIKQMMTFLKEEIRAAVSTYAPDSVKMFLKKEELNYQAISGIKEEVKKEVKCDTSSETKEGSKEGGEEKEKGFWGKLWNSLKNFIYDLKEGIKSFWNSIIDILKTIINIIKGVIQSLFTRVDELLMKFYITGEDIAEKGANIVLELLFNQIEEVLKAYTEAFEHAHKM